METKNGRNGGDVLRFDGNVLIEIGISLVDPVVLGVRVYGRPFPFGSDATNAAKSGNAVALSVEVEVVTNVV